MLEILRKEVCAANLRLVREGLVTETFGNVSAVDRESGHVVIKPSGLPYDKMAAKHMVVVSLESGETVAGDLCASSDTPTHLELYRAFESIGGVVHTHSTRATAWAQARRNIPPYGTTHADYFFGSVPCARPLTEAEVRGEYEANTGKVIVEHFLNAPNEPIDPQQMTACLVSDHGPFAWGETADAAVTAAAHLEIVAQLASETVNVEAYPRMIPQYLLEKHFMRKHGPNAYYGQS
ncbi:MAG: L-ribulose-5-phosphate 4-epimerase AraD [Planctomycetes bacterium]|jgi:L-ribulose-5-phosphate 4-epimerase|nr:L-ribulose-5-phosphate 4-epimerase AraD [Phycisphaerae bacterium]NBB95385.1 L-ribulose-5-phosphate 4-epimerase AraD [Planctomycetota bacterium]